MPKFEEVQNLLTRVHPKLSPKLQKAAAFLLENPEKIATQSMRKVATDSGVALPNFARLAKAIGFDKYNELRDVYRKQVQIGQYGGYPERADRLQSLGKASSDKSIWSSFHASAIQNIEHAYRCVDAKLIGLIVEQLLNRDHIHLVGALSSYPFTEYVQYVGSMVLPKFKLLGRPGGIMADDLLDIKDNDAVLCIAIQPCARIAVEVAKLAYERGIYVVGITDSRASPLATYSTEILLTSRESPMFFESYICSVAIIELLLGFMALRAGPEVVTRIAQIESDRRLLKEYYNTTREH